jgi:C1A family cysteine protease
MMKMLIIVALLAPLCLASLNIEDKFANWQVQYGKTYNSKAEYQSALNAFAANEERIASHNSQGLSWELGHNQFSDLTKAQMKQRFLRAKPPPAHLEVATELLNATATPPASLDWVAKGAVTPVKDQANCGSCWAFSTTGAIEGAYQVKTGKLLSLSEQNLVSCSFNGDLGCGGGEQTDGFCWTYHNKGICTEADYPYVSGGGQDGQACNPKHCTPAVTVSGYKAVPKGDENALMQALLLGPVAIGMDASEEPFFMYKKGIIDSPKCGKAIDHAILLVGYGTENGKNYWKVKNSWNKSWGEGGYLRVARGKDMCAVADGASYPIGTGPASSAAPSPAPTAQCPKIAPPPPRLPEAYSVNVTQTWGDPKFPGSGMFYVSNNKLMLANSGYMMLDETQLYRCDKDQKATIPGQEYLLQLKDPMNPKKGQKCTTDPTGTDSMICPWSRWSNEIMSQFISAELKTASVACPKNPYVEQPELAGKMCSLYQYNVPADGTSAEMDTSYWMTTDGIPVKEYQVLKGKQGFKLSTWYSNYKVGEPSQSVFAIPKFCKAPPPSPPTAFSGEVTPLASVESLPPAEYLRRKNIIKTIRDTYMRAKKQ